MGRIIVEPASSGNDLSDRFVKALNLLNEHGVKLRAGTQLASRYAVIVADNPAKALEHLHGVISQRLWSDSFLTVPPRLQNRGLSKRIKRLDWFASFRETKGFRSGGAHSSANNSSTS